MNEIQLDKNGGVIPETRAEMQRAKRADLVTLPKKMIGTNCESCEYFSASEHSLEGLGFCNHKEVELIVSYRQCCIFWDNPKALRPWPVA